MFHRLSVLFLIIIQFHCLFTQTCSPNCKNGCPERSSTCNGWRESSGNHPALYCAPGYYGSTCTATCPPGCSNSICATGGNCLGWYESSSHDPAHFCKAGFYGSTCSSKCSENCAQTACAVGGNCIGWSELSGHSPSLHCKDGFYGSTCSGICSKGCASSKCAVSGNCVGWSESGGHDKACICKPGYYGSSCKETCPTNCRTTECAVGGNCFGWSGSSGHDPAKYCKDGFHGSTCGSSCPTNCAKGYCAVGGNCHGWYESSSSDPATYCKIGFYGSTCGSPCPPECPRCLGSGSCPKPILMQRVNTTHVQTNDYSTSKALQAAYYSAATYCSPEEVFLWSCEACKSIRGVSLTKPIVHIDEKTFLFGYVTFNVETKSIVVAFRGTNGLPTEPSFRAIFSILNWRSNLDMKLVDYPYPLESASKNGVKVHQGFLHSYGRIRENLFRDIREILRIYPSANLEFTGHSLGGALATLAIMDIHTRLQNNTSGTWAIHTFGSPRVGNERYVEYFHKNTKLKSWRVVHFDDIVAQLPPLIPSYRHVATEVWYQKNSASYKVCRGNEDPECNLSVMSKSVESHARYLDIPITAMCGCKQTFCENQRWGNCCENEGRLTGCCTMNQKDGSCRLCNYGRWGMSDCESQCSENCAGTCKRDTGVCDLCKYGKWGANCENSCSTGCSGWCNRADGSCTTCNYGMWGDQCQGQCNCGGKACHRTTGVCT